VPITTPVGVVVATTDWSPQRVEEALSTASRTGRIAAIAAVAIAIVAVALIIFSGGSSYKVYAIFQDASQLVPGDQVTVAGNPIGTVGGITLTPNGQARLELDIANSSYQPLHQGTIATVRNPSLTSIANRYVDLRLPPGDQPSIPSGGTIPAQDTNSAVDLDEIFNTLDPATRKGLQNLIQGSAIQYCGTISNTNCNGYGAKAAAAWQYLNPAVASASTLFSELNRDTGRFTNFITKTGNLFSDVATRQSDLSALVQNLSTTTNALANQHIALGQSIQELPGFMRLSNTTFVNLRSALDDLKPLVDDSKPVAPKLYQLLLQLRPLAQNSVPTVKDLSSIIHKPGANNDLIDLVKKGVPLANATVNTVNANGAARQGAFPASTQALQSSTPELATARPYSVDLTGWFEGYSHPAGVDANGGYARVAPVVSAFSASSGGGLTFLPAVLRLLNAQQELTFGQGDRCPGSMERGAVYYPETGFPCNPSEVPSGP
jgi:phospholipid/cholesterol/gamma-HCH transport system substrate-binding protein